MQVLHLPAVSSIVILLLLCAGLQVWNFSFIAKLYSNAHLCIYKLLLCHNHKLVIVLLAPNTARSETLGISATDFSLTAIHFFLASNPLMRVIVQLLHITGTKSHMWHEPYWINHVWHIYELIAGLWIYAMRHFLFVQFCNVFIC